MDAGRQCSWCGAWPFVVQWDLVALAHVMGSHKTVAHPFEEIQQRITGLSNRTQPFFLSG